ncbi:MAG: GntR family transcriptional regulator [Planctomycetaceae bacterium]|nr:GntR family transcriptional regulator [Planctomycetaceae bacterium]
MPRFKCSLLADRLKSEIELGVRAPGQQIPAEEELAIRYSISRNTVRQAIGLLVEEGFLVKVQGSGTYVAERAVQAPRPSVPAASKSIGVVLPRCTAYIYPEVLMGISESLFEHEYTMVYRITSNRIAKERQILTELLSTNLAGLIIEPTRSAWPLLNEDLYRRIEERMPCILTHAVLPGFRFPTIGVSDVDGVALVIDHFVANGHKRIAGIFKSDEQTGTGRFKGYGVGLARNNLAMDENAVLWFMDEDFDSLFTDQNAHRVFSALDGCTAVFCHNDEVVSRLYPFLERHNRRIPDDISIAGFDDSFNRHDMKPLTTIENPKSILGKKAVEALLALIANPEADVSMRFPPKLIFRDTVKNLRS